MTKPMKTLDRPDSHTADTNRVGQTALPECRCETMQPEALVLEARLIFSVYNDLAKQ